MIRKAIFILLFAAGATPLFAQLNFDFGVAPKFNGNFDIFLKGNYNFGSRFYTSLRLEYERSEDSNKSQETNYSTELNSTSKAFDAKWDAFGVYLVNREFRLGIALTAQYIYFKSDEALDYIADTGYEIIPGSSEMTLSNYRNMHILLPKIDLRAQRYWDHLWFDVSGEYAPSVIVYMEQTANSVPIYPGFNEDGPVSTSGTYFSSNSYSIKGYLGHLNNILSFTIGAEYTYLPIIYDTATLGGVMEVDSIIRELRFNGDLILSFIRFGRFSPLVSARYFRSWTEIQGVENDIEFDNEWFVYLGLNYR